MKRRSSGFTLIELMIVVGLIAILAAVAYPLYEEQVRKTRRNAAKADLMEQAQFMERSFVSNREYPTVAQFDVPRDGSTKYYRVTTTVNNANFTYTIAAAPINAQAGDKCGTLSVNHQGVRSPSTAGCW